MAVAIKTEMIIMRKARSLMNLEIKAPDTTPKIVGISKASDRSFASEDGPTEKY